MVKKYVFRIAAILIMLLVLTINTVYGFSMSKEDILIGTFMLVGGSICVVLVWLSPIIIVIKRRSKHMGAIIAVTLLIGWFPPFFAIPFIWALCSPSKKDIEAKASKDNENVQTENNKE